MGDSAQNNNLYLAISGGTAILRRDVLKIVKEGITPAISIFNDQLIKIEQIQHINKELKAKLAAKRASKVASILAAENPSPRPVLWGLIQETARKTAKATCREIIDKKNSLVPPQQTRDLSKQEQKTPSPWSQDIQRRKAVCQDVKNPKAAKQRDTLPPQKSKDPSSTRNPPTRRTRLEKETKAGRENNASKKGSGTEHRKKFKKQQNGKKSSKKPSRNWKLICCCKSILSMVSTLISPCLQI